MVTEVRKEKRTVVIPTLSEAATEVSTFKNDLRYIRQKYQLTFRDMGKTLGVDHALVYRWETGELEPDNFNFMVIKLWMKTLKEYSTSY